MKIRMLEDARGCPDGQSPRDYEAGLEYEVPEVLYRDFKALGCAVPAEPPAATSGASPAGDETVKTTTPPVEESEGADTKQRSRRNR